MKPTTKPEKTRTEIIAEAAAKKKAATTAPGPVTPAKAVPTRIPAKLNATTGVSKKEASKKRTDDTSTVTQKEPLVTSKERTKIPVIKDDDVEQEVQAEADKELDANVKPKKKDKDPNELTVSDVAKEVGIEPKVARQRLRKDGARATDGRWPTVIKGSKEHADLVAKLKGGNDAKPKPTKAKAKTEPTEEVDDEAEEEDDSNEETEEDAVDELEFEEE